ncbi:MAG: hypothetical protein ACHREM_11785 [Polyangiales bacterium]
MLVEHARHREDRDSEFLWRSRQGIEESTSVDRCGADLAAFDVVVTAHGLRHRRRRLPSPRRGDERRRRSHGLRT